MMFCESAYVHPLRAIFLQLSAFRWKIAFSVLTMVSPTWLGGPMPEVPPGTT